MKKLLIILMLFVGVSFLRAAEGEIATPKKATTSFEKLTQEIDRVRGAYKDVFSGGKILEKNADYLNEKKLLEKQFEADVDRLKTKYNARAGHHSIFGVGGQNNPDYQASLKFTIDLYNKLREKLVEIYNPDLKKARDRVEVILAGY